MQNPNVGAINGYSRDNGWKKCVYNKETQNSKRP